MKNIQEILRLLLSAAISWITVGMLYGDIVPISSDALKTAIRIASQQGIDQIESPSIKVSYDDSLISFQAQFFIVLLVIFALKKTSLQFYTPREKAVTPVTKYSFPTQETDYTRLLDSKGHDSDFQENLAFFRCPITNRLPRTPTQLVLNNIPQNSYYELSAIQGALSERADDLKTIPGITKQEDPITAVALCYPHQLIEFIEKEHAFAQVLKEASSNTLTRGTSNSEALNDIENSEASIVIAAVATAMAFLICYAGSTAPLQQAYLIAKPLLESLLTEFHSRHFVASSLANNPQYGGHEDKSQAIYDNTSYSPLFYYLSLSLTFYTTFVLSTFLWCLYLAPRKKQVINSIPLCGYESDDAEIATLLKELSQLKDEDKDAVDDALSDFVCCYSHELPQSIVQLVVNGEVLKLAMGKDAFIDYLQVTPRNHWNIPGRVGPPIKAQDQISLYSNPVTMLLYKKRLKTELAKYRAVPEPTAPSNSR